MSATVDLLTPQLAINDATSNHTRLIQGILREKGIKTQIIVEQMVGPDDVISLEKWEAGADITILQHFIGSNIAQHIIEEQIPIVLNYHNITPASFFRYWEPQTASSIEIGREQLHQLAPLTRRAITDSEYNAEELRELDIQDVITSPVLWHLDTGHNGEHYTEASTIPAGGGTILFVGRIAPNKCQHDLIMALAMLTYTRPKSRLVFVGDPTSVAYFESLRVLAKQLGVYDRVFFAGKVPAEDLIRCYRSADVFACVSEHEGFGVPLAEAMAYGLPIVAYDSAAVSQTLEGAGLLLSDKRPLTLATALNRVLGDDRLRNHLRDRGTRMAGRFDISVTGEQMWAALKDLLSE